jgi:hypothetical protein
MRLMEEVGAYCKASLSGYSPIYEGAEDARTRRIEPLGHVTPLADLSALEYKAAKSG